MWRVAFSTMWSLACYASQVLSLPSSPVDFLEPASVRGLSINAESTDIVLVWPSNPNESFVVLWQSNAAPEASWIALTNQLPASRDANCTSFCDAGRVADSHDRKAFAELHRVFVIPDFWFDMNAVALAGGPKKQGENNSPRGLG